MKQLFTLFGFTLLALSVKAQDSCQNALVVGQGIHNANYTPQSQIPQPICTNGTNNNPSMGIWFRYTPTATYNTTVTTNVPGYPLHDTRVQIYSGTCGNLVCVAGDDDSGPDYTSVVTFPAIAGTTYYIAFDNNWDSSNFVFQLSEAPYNPPVFTNLEVDISGSYIMCVVDMNGDYLDDIVVPQNNGVQVLYQNNEGSFTEALLPADNTPYMPGWSMAAGDYDKNGFNDLLYGNTNGATLMLANEDGTAFEAFLSPQSIFSQRTNFIDINNDGHLDAFVCHDVQPNVYFLNDGEGGFTYIQGGLGDYPSGGNYGSIWVDYDNDGDADLFIAKCRGGNDPAGINELHRNDGDGNFTNVSQEANMADLLQTWSTAWGDFDNDGYMDAMVGANSTSSGSHKLMHNNGDGTFTDVTAGSGIENFTPLSREHIAHDFNNDGYIDVMGGDNYILYNNGDMTFTAQVINAYVGPVGDLNNDGFLDILNGSTVKLNNGNDNNWLKLNLLGIDSNGNGIGARVEIHGTWGIQIRDVRSGEGFRYMSTLNTHFGIGTADEIEQVVIKWPSGIVDTVENPDINQTLFVEEGSTILNSADFTVNEFSIFPNPAKDVINFAGPDNTTVTQAAIFDMNGRLVKTADAAQNSVDVQNLAKGTYLLLLKDTNGKHYSSKFIKN